MTTQPQPHSKCNDCDAEFASRDEAREHMSQTMAPVTGEGGITARGHGVTTVSPTDEERAERRARNTVSIAIEDAVTDCLNELQREIDRGYVTEEQVTAELASYPDFADAWDEWLADADA